MTPIWRGVFLTEVGALSALCLWWAAWPGQYVAWVVGAASPAPEVQVLQHAAAAALVAWTFFYGALLFRRVELETFRLVQQALALGSILLMAVAYGLWREASPDASALILHLVVLGASLTVRGAFLARTRAPTFVLEPG